MQEKFEDVQVVVGSYKSKVKQYNDLMKKDKSTINNLQNKITENWKLRNRNPTKTGSWLSRLTLCAATVFACIIFVIYCWYRVVCWTSFIFSFLPWYFNRSAVHNKTTNMLWRKWNWNVICKYQCCVRRSDYFKRKYNIADYSLLSIIFLNINNRLEHCNITEQLSLVKSSAM